MFIKLLSVCVFSFSSPAVRVVTQWSVVQSMPTSTSPSPPQRRRKITFSKHCKVGTSVEMYFCGFSCMLVFLPFPPSSGMLRSRLRGRASKALVGVGRHLSQGGTAVTGSAQLLQALRTFHISIAQEVQSAVEK